MQPDKQHRVPGISCEWRRPAGAKVAYSSLVFARSMHIEAYRTPLPRTPGLQQPGYPSEPPTQPMPDEPVQPEPPPDPGRKEPDEPPTKVPHED